MPILSSAKVRRGSFRPAATPARDTAADEATIQFLVGSQKDPIAEADADQHPARLYAEQVLRELAERSAQIAEDALKAQQAIARPVALTLTETEFTASSISGALFEADEGRGAAAHPIEAQVASGGGRDLKHGTVKWFNPTKGYAFITPDDGGKGVFVKISPEEAQDMPGLGDDRFRIQYETEERAARVRREAKVRRED